jgi:hypothetical protein
MDESFEIRFVEVVKSSTDDGVIVVYAVGFLARVVQIGRVKDKSFPVGACSFLRLKLKYCEQAHNETSDYNTKLHIGSHLLGRGQNCGLDFANSDVCRSWPGCWA